MQSWRSERQSPAWKNSQNGKNDANGRLALVVYRLNRATERIHAGGSSRFYWASRAPSASVLCATTIAGTPASTQQDSSGLALQLLASQTPPGVARSAASSCCTTQFIGGRRERFRSYSTSNRDSLHDLFLTGQKKCTPKSGSIFSACWLCILDQLFFAHVIGKPADRRRLQQDAQHHATTETGLDLREQAQGEQ